MIGKAKLKTRWRISMRMSTRQKELDLDEELLIRVSEGFPAPIANPIMLLEIDLASRHLYYWSRAFGRIIDCFEYSVNFLALVSTAAYLQRHEKSANHQILTLSNEKISVGQWFELFRETLKAHQYGPPSCLTRHLAANCYKPNGKQTKVGKMLDTIPPLRNKKKGHCWTLPESEYRELVTKHYPDLQSWLSTLKFMEDFWLIEILECGAHTTGYYCEADLLRGSRRYHRRIELECKTHLEKNRLYMVPALEKGSQIDDSAILCLYPFIVRERNGNSAGDVFLFESNKPGGPVYVSSLDSREISVNENNDDFEAMLARVKSWSKEKIPLPESLVMCLKDPYGKARSKTQAAIEQMRNDGIYDPNLYTERREFEDQFNDFLDNKDKPAMIIAGESGIGKSNFMCAFATKFIEDGDLSRICLLLGPHDFPTNTIFLDESVRSFLGIKSSFKEWIQELRRRAGKKHDSVKITLILLLDSIDKHPSSESLLRAVDNWIKEMHGEWLKVKVVVTSTEAGLHLAEQASVALSTEAYYAPVHGILSPSGKPSALPFVKLPPFDKNDLKKAYRRYRKHEKYQPRTEWQNLSKTAHRALTHPLFLRLAMEVYNQDQIPKDPMSDKILLEYCRKYIFRNRDRATKYFVDCLVDMMLKQSSRQMSVSKLSSDPRLREGVLASGPNSPLNRLLDDQVLQQRPREQTESFALLPEEYIEFPMDMVFQYLLVNRAIAQWGLSSEGIATMAQRAKEFPSLRAGLVDLLGSLAKHGSYDYFTILLDEGFSGWQNQDTEGWMISLLSEILIDLSNDGEDGQASAEDPDSKALSVSTEMSTEDKFVSYLFRRDAGFGLYLIFRGVDTLFIQGRWGNAVSLLQSALKTNRLSELDRFKIINSLVVLHKVLDTERWWKARAYSDENEAFVESAGASRPIPTEHLVHHYLNRFSVLHDLGERAKAAELCQKAFDLAKEDQLHSELAAGANNMGIANVLFDKVEQAEAFLNAGVNAEKVNHLLKGHNFLNRGLLRLLKARLAKTGLAEAKNDLDEAAHIFREMVHVQGTVYGDGSLGLLLMYEEKWKDSKEYLDRSAKTAERHREKWPKYVAWANLALWHWQCRNPQRNLSEAYKLAEEAYEGAKELDDAEGIALSGMILARILMDKDPVDFDRPEVTELLTIAEKKMNDLEYHSPAALACAGLLELAEKKQEDGDAWRKKRDYHRSFLVSASFPVNFAECFVPMDWKFWFLAEMR